MSDDIGSSRDLRDVVADWLQANLFWGLDPSKKLDAADQILALPEVAALLDAQAAVSRVRDAVAVAGPMMPRAAVRRALDGNW